MKTWLSLILTLVLPLMGCSPTADLKRLNSNTLDTADARIDSLKQVVQIKSDILDAEYNLFSANGFANQKSDYSIPASSFWHYSIAVKIDPKDAIKWADGLTEASLEGHHNIGWATALITKRASQWQTVSKPISAIFNDAGLNIEQLTYIEEGIVFRNIIQQ